MTEPIGNPDFDSKEAMEGIDRILASIEEGYGLTRDEAVSCLTSMAHALRAFEPGDPGLQARFHHFVLNAVDDRRTWAKKVDRAIESWGDRA